MDPQNNGHIGGTSHFVLYREVVLILEVKDVLLRMGPQSVSFTGGFFFYCVECPLSEVLLYSYYFKGALLNQLPQ